MKLLTMKPLITDDTERLRTILGQVAVLLFAGIATELLFVREAALLQLIAAFFGAGVILACAVVEKFQFQTGK